MEKSLWFCCYGFSGMAGWVVSTTNKLPQIDFYQRLIDGSVIFEIVTTSVN